MRPPFEYGRILLFTTLLASCSDGPDPSDEPFTVVGEDTELYGEWDVNALAPSADICTRAEIDTVEVAFSNADDSETFTSPTFRWPCGPGYYDSPGPALRVGTFGYRWRAYHGDEMVLQSRRYSATASPGGEVVLMPVDFVRRVNVRVVATLTWDTGTGQGSCADAFVDTMSWELRRDTATGAVVASSSGDVPCDGTITIPDLPTGILEEGTHVLVVHGDAADSAMWDAECGVEVFESGEAGVACTVGESIP